ncbi:MAG: hypothetical protein KJS83_02410 [Xanthomonadaceae bacterium]|nr:hypothetical protein [Xanthomonadaceae bacterium]
MRIASVGHAVFAAVLVGIGILGLVRNDLVQGWGGVPRDLSVHGWLPWLNAVVCLICGLGLFWRRTAAPAARVLLVYFLLWFVLFKLSYIVVSPGVEGNYENAAETAVVVAGAWVLYAWFATDSDRRWLGFATGDSGVRIARVFYALAMIAFGLAHFFYLDLTAPLVPAWLPWHVGWAYFFGCTYVAAGVAMLIGVYARLATVLSTVQMGLFTLLVWVPLVAAGVARTSQVGEFIVSCILTAAGWVVADSWRGVPWLIVGGRGFANRGKTGEAAGATISESGRRTP